MIQVQNLSFKFGSRWLFQDVSFELKPGEWLNILGPPQSGKTTLLAILAGLQKDFEGEVILDDRSELIGNDSAMSAFRNQHMGICFDHHQVMKSLSVIENLKMRSLVHGTDFSFAEPLIKTLDLEHTGEQPASSLSQSERHRLSLALALFTKPRILLLDDPFNGLSEHMWKQILTWWHEKEDTMIITTGDHLTYNERCHISIDLGVPT